VSIDATNISLGVLPLLLLCSVDVELACIFEALVRGSQRREVLKRCPKSVLWEADDDGVLVEV